MKFFCAKILCCFLIILFWFGANFQNIFALESTFLNAQIKTSWDPITSTRRTNIMTRTLGSVLFPFTYDGLSIFLDTNQIEPRGQFRAKNITLSASIKTDSEFVQLFVHELGHFIDIYLLRENELTGDISDDFYKISWQKPNIKNTDASLSSFISGYAATNQYEDFAESFVWYIFHNGDFYDKALKNHHIRAKYLFFAEKIFTNKQFQWSDFSVQKPPKYFWDTTKIPILLQNYLSFLK